jgi:RHS repeat-associated protein
LVTDQYDFENHLILRTNPDGSTVQVAYDGDGNRTVKTVTTATNTLTTFYLVDDLNPTGYAQVLEELTLNADDPRFSAPAVTRVSGYGHVLLSQDQLVGGAWVSSFYGYDGHGNVRYLTDLTGAVTDTFDYDAFGNLIAQTGTTPNLYLFTGEQWDADLGLYYLRARYRNPDTGRFWTADSFAGFNQDPQSLHRYAYCANNPVNRVDPSGNSSLSEVMTAGGIGAATQGLIGTLLRGVMAYSEGLSFKESAQAAFDPADVEEDVGTGFIAGLTGWGAGKAAAAIAKPVFQALERGAPFLLNWTQRWVVRPLTQVEARLQAAWTSWRNGVLANRGAASAATQLEFEFARNLDNPTYVLYKASDFSPSMLGPGEYRLNLPFLRNEGLDWAQNRQELLKAVSIGNPIREANPNALGGWLQRERDFLTSLGWQRVQRGIDFFWVKPQAGQ